MSVYLNNYWSLYSEFVNIFKNIAYKSIPLALATNFYQHINSDLQAQMAKKEFSRHLKHAGIHQQSDIQPFFERKLNTFKNTVKNVRKSKIVISADHTRLPDSTFKNVFSKNDTIVVSRSKKTEHHGIPNIYLERYKRETKAHASKLVKMATRLFKKYPKHPVYRNSHFMTTFLNEIPTMVSAIETIYNLYLAVKPKVVIIGTTEDVYSRAFALVGLMCGVPTICLQHGLLMGEEAFMPVFTSYVAVYGQYEKDWYVTRGVKAEQIETIGHPRYDELTTSASQASQSEIKQIERKILLATGPSLNPTKFQSFVSQLAANPANLITIKPHPWEVSKNKLASYTALEKKYKNIQVNKERQVNTNDLIRQSDCVISSLSTVALEAMLLNKPSFVYYFIESNREYDYFNNLGKYAEKDPKKLITVIHTYFKSEQERNAYEQVKQSFLQQSYSTVNASKELLNMAQKVTFQ